jgi:hypothetical protein
VQRADSPEGFPRVEHAIGDHALSARPVGSWGGRPLPDLERSWESATVSGRVVCGTMSHDVSNAKFFHMLISLLI